MAQMNEMFMTAVARKAMDIFNSLQAKGVTRKAFCDKLKVPGSYLSSLYNTSNWSKIPTWAWFLFQDLTNGKIVFNNKGEIVHIAEGYTLEDIHEDCRVRAEKYLNSKRTNVEEVVVDDVIPDIDMTIKKYAKDSMPELIDEESVIFFTNWFVDKIIERKKQSIEQLRELKKEIAKWKKKK